MADSTKPSRGWTGGTSIVASADGKAVPRVAITTGAALWAR